MSKEKRSHFFNPVLLDELVEVTFDDSEDWPVAYPYKVYMTQQVLKRYGKAHVNSRARCRKIMEFYARDGGDNLSIDKFRSEGWFHTGDKDGKNVQIFAFKAYQLRVYGARIPDTRCFICTEIEVAKKKGSADQDKLKRTARKLAQFI